MKRSLFLVAAVAALGAAAACYQDNSMAPRTRQPMTKVLLTDDPFPYDTVKNVDLYIESISATTDADTSSSADWVTLAQPNRRFDLLAYQNGNAAILDSALIPAGSYRAVRVVLNTDSSWIIGEGGNKLNINWQSHAGHPVLYAYIERPIGISDSGATVVIDFDVGRSFIWYTTQNEFVFSAVVRAVEREATGTVTGHLSVAGPQSTIYAYLDGGVRATARTDGNGNYTLAYLVPGTYDIVFVPQPGEPLLPDTVAVTVIANQTVQAPDLSPASCGIEGCSGWGSDSSGTDTTGTSDYVLTVSPDPLSLVVGQTGKLTATVTSRSGGSVPDYTATWGVLDSAYVSVDANGNVTALSAGSDSVAVARVIAVWANLVDTAHVHVRKP